MIIAGADLQTLCRTIMPQVPSTRIGFDSVDVTLHQELLVPKHSASITIELDKIPAARDINFRAFEDSLFTSVDMLDFSGYQLCPGGFIKGKLAEAICLPFGYTAIFSLRSKHAQVGLQQAVSVFIRGGWAGNLVVELSNTSTFRLLLTAGMVIGQIHVFRNSFNRQAGLNYELYERTRNINPNNPTIA